MNTEQQLIERAEEILIKHNANPSEGESIKERVIIPAMIDFHEQELQRIGEVFYVPVSVEDELPEKSGWYWCINPNNHYNYGLNNKCDLLRFGSNGQWTNENSDGEHPSHWLKKLSLLEVKENISTE